MDTVVDRERCWADLVDDADRRDDREAREVATESFARKM